MVVDSPCLDARGLEQAWRDALVAKDEPTLRRLIHPQFKLVGVRATGPVSVDLEQWITALQRMDIANLDVRVTECVSLDDTMVATVDAQWKVRYLGQLIDERVLLTDVWVRVGNDWQVLRRHSSPLACGAKID
ncbi:nuclear transport factor 2 family protein [Sphingomonas sp. LY29]|uniref:nuclear transport factor 2 family protein n=1 Tax=unclassified Sphingomonas TaxID=196159 RepID=UPI002ADEF565|nr:MULTISPECIES: nuclear transport factor 2 family protein [unclassified Sphingomonas]MEA1071966.1 nuclear transport factor 2 family protein [Sphingomonas sp. LY160]WRP25347.1 nuclear transport factor 2 family protein [Sphingomonas sp. LY29]